MDEQLRSALERLIENWEKCANPAHQDTMPLSDEAQACAVAFSVCARKLREVLAAQPATARPTQTDSLFDTVLFERCATCPTPTFCATTGKCGEPSGVQAAPATSAEPQITGSLLRDTNVGLGSPLLQGDDTNAWEFFADALNQRLAALRQPTPAPTEEKH